MPRQLPPFPGACVLQEYIEFDIRGSTKKSCVLLVPGAGGRPYHSASVSEHLCAELALPVLALDCVSITQDAHITGPPAPQHGHPYPSEEDWNPAKIAKGIVELVDRFDSVHLYGASLTMEFTLEAPEPNPNRWPTTADKAPTRHPGRAP